MSGATDYQVGDGKAYTSLQQVPWESLKGGDTVRLFYRATPYKGKFAITTSGSSAAAPIRVCGVRGPGNERPIIDGNGAVTRTTTAYINRLANTADIRAIHEGRTVILLKSNAADYPSFPRYVQIDGLNIVRGYPSYTFTDSTGATKSYDAFGACIWVDRGQDILIADNEISDCSHAIFTKSTDDGSFAVTTNIRIAGNFFWGNGYTGDASTGADRVHTTYTQSKNLVIEFNRYGALRSGAGGNAVKDRSVGTVVRYNRIEAGAHAIDLVEAEDFYVTALADPAYRSTFVYGNQISKSGETGSFIHYGGDHQGPDNPNCATVNYGECLFRQGTLYFFNNSIYATGSGAAIFQISTTKETAEIWNNVIHFDSAMTAGQRSLRADQEVAAGYTSGGTVNLGRNWITTGWLDSDIYHPVSGVLSGVANLLTGASAPFDLTTFVPLAGAAIVDAGVSGPSAASAYTVGYQLNSSYKGVTRSVVGSAIDLGAFEKP